MRKVSFGKVLSVLALAFLVAGSAFAQDKGIVVAAGWAPSYVSVSGGSTTAPIGVMFDVAGTVAPNIQIVGDFGYNYKSESGASVSFLTGTGGVRYVIPQAGGKATPFVEGLAGLSYLSAALEGLSGSQAGLAFGVGGGVDVKATDKLNVRLQANYFLNRISGVTINEFRFGVGISTSTKSK